MGGLSQTSLCIYNNKKKRKKSQEKREKTYIWRILTGPFYKWYCAQLDDAGSFGFHSKFVSFHCHSFVRPPKKQPSLARYYCQAIWEKERETERDLVLLWCRVSAPWHTRSISKIGNTRQFHSPSLLQQQRIKSWRPYRDHWYRRPVFFGSPAHKRVEDSPLIPSHPIASSPHHACPSPFQRNRLWTAG